MIKQTFEGFTRRNVKNNKKDPITRFTHSNYSNITKLGKSKVGYTTTELFKGKKGMPMIRESQFIASGSPVKDFIAAIEGARPGQMGKKVAKAFNPTPQYKALVESEKKAGRLHSGFENPQVMSGAKVHRQTEMIRAATAEDIVNAGGAVDWGGKLGKTGRKVREETEKQMNSAKTAKEREALEEQLEKAKEVNTKKKTGIVKGVANVFGAFMSGFRGN